VPSTCGGIFEGAEKEKKIKALEEASLEETFWTDQARAQKIIAELNELRSWLNPYYDIVRRIDDVAALFEEAKKEKDETFLAELAKEVEACEKKTEELEFRKMLSGEYDRSNCFLSINAGAGGTEACDWAQMLLRMYQRWATSRGWKVSVVDVLDGEVAGIRNATIHIVGEYAYGFAQAERGVHRLVRISPFDSNARRHTSFAAIDVSPTISDDVVVEIRPEDIRIDTYRASGAGGQHVNKTDSAVRITHLPTNIIVSSQGERSQIQNREACMKMLRSRLVAAELEKRQKTLQTLSGEKKSIEWGSQIRSYVFQPYTLVKDHRTGVEVGNAGAVMDGALDEFIYAYLKEFGGA